jgi:hypothetical protein
MKNEKKFKERISNLAAMIAEGNYEEKEVEEKPEEVDEAGEAGEVKATADASRIADVLDQIKRLEPYFDAINTAAEVRDVINHIVSMMTSPQLTNGNKRSGLNLALTGMAKDAAANSTPAVGKKDPNAMYDKMKVPKGVKSDSNSDLPALQEAFNRINRK